MNERTIRTLKMEWVRDRTLYGDGLPTPENLSPFRGSPLEGQAMKITYAPKTDTLTIILKDNVPVEESDESKPGVILDYDKEGSLVSLEVLDASERVSETQKIDFQKQGRFDRTVIRFTRLTNISV